MRRAWALAAVGLLAGCGGEGDAAEAPAPATVTETVTAAPEDWRAIWTEAPTAEADFLADAGYLLDLGDAEIVDLGRSICGAYERGVSEDEVMATLAEDIDVLVVVPLNLAAKHHFCMNLDPPAV